MNLGIGTEAVQYHFFWEYLFRMFTVFALCSGRHLLYVPFWVGLIYKLHNFFQLGRELYDKKKFTKKDFTELLEVQLYTQYIL